MSFFYYIYILKPTIFLEKKKKIQRMKQNETTKLSAQQSSHLFKRTAKKGLQTMSEWYYKNKQPHEKKNAPKLIIKNISP